MSRATFTCLLKLVVFYSVLLALLIAFQPFGGAMAMAKAKWVMTLLPGFAAGLLSNDLPVKQAAVATLVFSFLLACGWTLFSVVGRDLDGERSTLVFLASLPLMAFAGLWAFLGLLAGNKIRSSTRLAKRPEGSAARLDG